MNYLLKSSYSDWILSKCLAKSIYMYEYCSKKKSKKWFWKRFSNNLMNNAAFGKTIENVRKHRDMKLVTTGRRRNYLVSQSNYHTPKFFTEHLTGIEMKTT